MREILFQKYLQVEKRYSSHTVTAYLNDLGQLWAYLQFQYSIEDWAEVKTEFIRSWLVSLVDEGLQPKSINRKISSVSTFFRFCVKQNLLTINPAAGVAKPRNPKPLPVYLEERQTDRLIDEAAFEKNFKGIRDRLIIELLYTTGIRRQELIDIRPQDVDLAQHELKVRGKRNKERLIPISAELAALVSEYVKERKTETGGAEQSYLFELKSGKPLYPKFVYLLVNKYLARISVATKKSPHVLRHTFATQMLNRGADINAIKELLGHASLAATEVYTHNSISQLKNIHRTAHPKG